MASRDSALHPSIPQWNSFTNLAIMSCENPGKQCVEGSEGGGNGSAPETCANAVSQVPEMLNSDCASLCESGSGDFDNKCTYASFTESNGNAVPLGECYNQWIYGYSEGEQDLVTYTDFTSESTPNSCQERCQKDAECVNWIWKHNSQQCALKNQEMVQNALEIEVEETFPEYSWDSKFCNAGMGWSCYNQYICLYCKENSPPSCVWESVQHIAGFKLCNLADPCEISSEPTEIPLGSDPVPLGTTMEQGPPTTPGIATTFTTHNCANGAVLDFFLAQDITASYKNDLPHLQELMPKLVSDLGVFQIPRFGLASFGDKPIRPLGSPSSLDYCYRLEAPLSSNSNAMLSALDSLTTRSGIDWKESQLDAMIAASLQNDTNWRQSDSVEIAGQTLTVIKVLAVSTDAGYHIAGDGLEFAPEMKPNSATGAIDCEGEDYPSVEQLINVLKNTNIRPLFLVTRDVLPRYRRLQTTLEAAGIVVTVAELSEDSTNIVDTIMEGVTNICEKLKIDQTIWRSSSKLLSKFA